MRYTRVHKKILKDHKDLTKNINRINSNLPTARFYKDGKANYKKNNKSDINISDDLEKTYEKVLASLDCKNKEIKILESMHKDHYTNYEKVLNTNEEQLKSVKEQCVLNDTLKSKINELNDDKNKI